MKLPEMKLPEMKLPEIKLPTPPALPVSLPKPHIKLPRWAQTLHDNMHHYERVAVAWLIVILLVSAVWSVATFINHHTHLIAERGGIYTEAAVGQPHLLNPILAGANDVDVDITHLVYSSLFRLDTNLKLTPDLATSYEMSPDGKQYIIHLRSDVRWHDGEPFKADDVVFTIRSIQTPDYGSPLLSSFQGVDIQKVDDNTIVFKLTQPYAPFLSSLTVGIMPQHVWSNIAPKNAALAEQSLKPIGTGPYQFSQLSTRRKDGEITSLQLTRNNNFYGAQPYLDGVTFMFYPTHEEAVKAFTSGNVDGVGFLPLQLYKSVTDQHTDTLHQLLLPQYFGLFFNQDKNKALANDSVRSALNQGLDRQAIVADALHGEGESLYLPIPPGIFSFTTEFPSPSYNPEVAKQNLRDAGWKDMDSNGILKKDGQRLHIKLTTTDWPEYVRTAEIVSDQWRKIGVETEIIKIAPGTIQQSVVRPRDYEVLLFGEILSPDPDPYPFWHSTQSNPPGLNFSRFKNEEVDKLLEDARKATDPNVRREKLKEFQGKILDLKPALILYRPYYLFATKNDIHGINSHFAALPSDRFNDIFQWYIHTRRVWNN